jgi:hypothetical protein
MLASSANSRAYVGFLQELIAELDALYSRNIERELKLTEKEEIGHITWEEIETQGIMFFACIFVCEIQKETINPLALELDIYSLANHLCEM